MSENDENMNKLDPCSQPICNFNGKGCKNGKCRAPNICSCDVGWQGVDCGTCIPRPGCVHGSCKKGLDCICEPGWSGALCNIRKQKYQTKILRNN